MSLSNMKYWELVGMKECFNAPREIIFLTAIYVLHGARKFDEDKLVKAVYANDANRFMKAEKTVVVAGLKTLHLLAQTRMEPGAVSETIGLHIDHVLSFEHRYHEMVAYGAKEAIEHMHLM